MKKSVNTTRSQNLNKPRPPKSIAELQMRAEALAGKTLGQLANEFEEVVPKDLLIEKGWVGQFMEIVLGATAGSLPEPDFPHLGVELKTIPIDENGKPLESTYVSVVHLMNEHHETWESSLVKKKLSHVLFFPILSPKSLAIHERIVAMPLLWQPNSNEEAILRTDWEETMEKVALGKLGELNARFGEALQVRPKAANSKVLTDAIGPEGDRIKTLPRGFYLRSKFTQRILKQLTHS